MDEKLWNDVKDMVQRMLIEGNVSVETKAQKQRFTIIKLTDNFIRVTRKRSKLQSEDIPKEDFIDIWKDLNRSHYVVEGYQQRDLQEGQNRHSALSFALVGMLPYIEWKQVGRAWKLYLKR